MCNGHGKAVVVGTGMKTEFGKTFEEMRDMENRRTPLQVGVLSLGPWRSRRRPKPRNLTVSQGLSREDRSPRHAAFL